jgi:hypothetical protein
MAQRVEVVLVDDVDGGPADETVAFALDGVTYEIDLNATNAAALREALALYVGHARKAGRKAPARSSSRRSAAGSQTAAIRAWAKEQGLPVNERGRIPASIVEQYEAAHA